MIYMLLNSGHEINRASFSHSLLLFNPEWYTVFQLGTEMQAMFGLFISWKKHEYSLFPHLLDRIEMEAVSVAAFPFNINEVYEGILLVKMYWGYSFVGSIFPENFDIKSVLRKHLCQLFKTDYEIDQLFLKNKKWSVLESNDVYFSEILMTKHQKRESHVILAFLIMESQLLCIKSEKSQKILKCCLSFL